MVKNVLARARIDWYDFEISHKSMNTRSVMIFFRPLKSLTIYQQLCSFLLLCKFLCHYMSLTPSKSMPQKSNHDFKEKYPYIRVGTLEPLRIKAILTQKNSCFLTSDSFIELE